METPFAEINRHKQTCRMKTQKTPEVDRKSEKLIKITIIIINFFMTVNFKNQIVFGFSQH